MEAVKRLAVGTNFTDLRKFTYDSYESWCKDSKRLDAILNDQFTSIEVHKYGIELETKDYYYSPDFRTTTIEVTGNDKVTLEEYEEFLKTYSREQYEQEVKETTQRLAEIGDVVKSLIDEGVNLSKEVGIEWTIELDNGNIVPELAQYVDWQSSTIGCAKYQ